MEPTLYLRPIQCHALFEVLLSAAYRGYHGANETVSSSRVPQAVAVALSDRQGRLLARIFDVFSHERRVVSVNTTQHS